MYIINTKPYGKCFVRYLRTRCFCIRNLTRSLRSLVRFLIHQQLVRKYRTPALSVKYSLYVHPKNSNNLRSHSRAIMALHHSRLHLQDKFLIGKQIRPNFLRFSLRHKILPTHLGIYCEPAFYTFYTSHLR